jgi:2-polyprenyl-3-methyl-5-hydroxy-6-metoxy-1,4-benzoquinol methylase
MRKECAWCGCEELTEVYKIFHKSIMKCSSCSLMQTYPQPNLEELSTIYSQEYYSNPKLLEPQSKKVYGYSNYVSERLIKQYGYQNILKNIFQYLEKKKITNRKLLEIGCGYGFFLDASFDFGFAPEGIEFSEHAINYIKNRYAFPVYHTGTPIPDIFGSNTFGSVALFDTIEHLQNPFQTLEEIYEILIPGGILIISTMDSISFMSRLLGKRLEDFRRVNEHLFFFDRKTIEKILTKKNFEVIRISSLGHIFEIGQLISRISIMLPVFRYIEPITRILKISHIKVPFNPRTKMVVYAIKR